MFLLPLHLSIARKYCYWKLSCVIMISNSSSFKAAAILSCHSEDMIVFSHLNPISLSILQWREKFLWTLLKMLIIVKWAPIVSHYIQASFKAIQSKYILYPIIDFGPGKVPLFFPHSMKSLLLSKWNLIHMLSLSQLNYRYSLIHMLYFKSLTLFHFLVGSLMIIKWWVRACLRVW